MTKSTNAKDNAIWNYKPKGKVDMNFYTKSDHTDRYRNPYNLNHTINNVSYIGNTKDNAIDYINPFIDKNTNINDIHLDDFFFLNDQFKIYYISNPTFEKGYPTTDPGFLIIINRYDKDRMSKVYSKKGLSLTRNIPQFSNANGNLIVNNTGMYETSYTVVEYNFYNRNIPFLTSHSESFYKIWDDSATGPWKNHIIRKEGLREIIHPFNADFTSNFTRDSWMNIVRNISESNSNYRYPLRDYFPFGANKYMADIPDDSPLQNKSEMEIRRYANEEYANNGYFLMSTVDLDKNENDINTSLGVILANYNIPAYQHLMNKSGLHADITDTWSEDAKKKFLNDELKKCVKSLSNDYISNVKLVDTDCVTQIFMTAKRSYTRNSNGRYKLAEMSAGKPNTNAIDITSRSFNDILENGENDTDDKWYRSLISVNDFDFTANKVDRKNPIVTISTGFNLNDWYEAKNHVFDNTNNILNTGFSEGYSYYKEYFTYRYHPSNLYMPMLYANYSLYGYNPYEYDISLIYKKVPITVSEEETVPTSDEVLGDMDIAQRYWGEESSKTKFVFGFDKVQEEYLKSKKIDNYKGLEIKFLDNDGNYTIKRPLFLDKSDGANKAKWYDLFVPSNYYVPEGLIWTEFGWYRDGITDDTTLLKNLKEYNDSFEGAKDTPFIINPNQYLKLPTIPFYLNGSTGLLQGDTLYEYLDKMLGDNKRKYHIFPLRASVTNGQQVLGAMTYDVNSNKYLSAALNQNNAFTYNIENGKRQMSKDAFWIPLMGREGRDFIKLSFMERYKQGYPFTKDIQDKTKMKHQHIEWTEWTSYFYPFSKQRNSYEFNKDSNYRYKMSYEDSVKIVESKFKTKNLLQFMKDKEAELKLFTDYDNPLATRLQDVAYDKAISVKLWEKIKNSISLTNYYPYDTDNLGKENPMVTYNYSNFLAQTIAMGSAENNTGKYIAIAYDKDDVNTNKDLSGGYVLWHTNYTSPNNHYKNGNPQDNRRYLGYESIGNQGKTILVSKENKIYGTPRKKANLTYFTKDNYHNSQTYKENLDIRKKNSVVFLSNMMNTLYVYKNLGVSSNDKSVNIEEKYNDFKMMIVELVREYPSKKRVVLPQIVMMDKDNKLYYSICEDKELVFENNTLSIRDSDKSNINPNFKSFVKNDAKIFIKKVMISGSRNYIDDKINILREEVFSTDET